MAHIKDNNDLDELGTNPDPALEVSIPVESTYGINETKDAIAFICAFAASAEKYNKIGLAGAWNIVTNLGPKAIAAISGGDMIPHELGDLQPNEIRGLAAFVQSELDIESEYTEDIVKRSVNIVAEIVLLAQDIKAGSKGANAVQGSTSA